MNRMQHNRTSNYSSSVSIIDSTGIKQMSIVVCFELRVIRDATCGDMSGVPATFSKLFAINTALFILVIIVSYERSLPLNEPRIHYHVILMFGCGKAQSFFCWSSGKRLSLLVSASGN